MADDAESAEEAEDGKKKKEKGGKSNLVPAIVLALGIAAGGYFMGGSGEPVVVGPTTTTTTPAAGVVTMDAISINLADGHFLKVGVGIELSETADLEAFPEEGVPKVQDMLIELCGGADINVLATLDGREELKKELKKRALKEFDGTVLGFYFTTFVMQ